LKENQLNYRFFWMIFLALTLLDYAGAQEKLKKVSINERISIKLPESLYVMTDEDIVQRNLTHRKPLGIYTSADRQAQFTINTAAAPWAGDDLTLLKDFYKSSLLNLYGDIEFKREQVEEINGRNYVVFEFLSSLRQEENAYQSQKVFNQYIYIQYTVAGDQIYIFSFQSPAVQMDGWQQTIGASMHTIKLKKNM